MSTVAKRVELVVRISNEPTSLGRLSAVTGSCGAEVLVARTSCDSVGTVALLVTDDESRSRRALEAAGFTCKANSIVLVEIPSKPGLTALLGIKLVRAGLSVLYSYSFQVEPGRSYAVFKTSDDDRAFYALEVEAMIHELAAAKNWERFATAPIEASPAIAQAA